MKQKRKRKHPYKTISKILFLFIILTSISSSYFALKYYKLLRVNQFSKNIILSDNYFLGRYDAYVRNPNSSDQESIPSSEESTYTRQEIIYYLELIRSAPLTSYECKIIDGYFETTSALTNNDLEALLYDTGYVCITDFGYNPHTEEAKKHQKFLTDLDLKEYLSKRTTEILSILSTFISKGGLGIQLSIPYISQLPKYPNGCEAVSATMLLQAAGFDISEDVFIHDYLPKEEVEIRWGCRYGPDPEKFYAGDPSSERGGWGCFAPVIVKALNLCIPASHIAKNLTGLSLDTLAQEYISQGIPVAIWITQNYSAVDEVYQWQSFDESTTYLYPKNQHCVVLVGYDKANYYIADPLATEHMTICDKDDLNLSYNSMGMQAVAIIEK